MLRPMATAAAGTTREPRIGDVGKYWWLPLAAGILTILVGIVALAYPGPTLLAIGILFGAYLTVWGTMSVITGISDSDTDTVLRVLAVILGLLTALAGLILIVRPGESVLTAAWVLGFWWTLVGILQLARGVVVAEGRVWNLLWGLLGLAAGIIILAQPSIGLVTLVWIVGIGLIFQGALEIAAGLALRRLRTEQRA
jgi:uncharacterized membrane protein HdeD (DUF308 family)